MEQNDMFGGREYLLRIAEEYEASGYRVPKKIAKLIRRERDCVMIGRVTKDNNYKLKQIKSLQKKVKIGSEIVIKYNNLKHLDNSGHLTGIAKDRRHRNDPDPLTAEDFKELPRIIKDCEEIRDAGRNVFGPKITIGSSANKKRTVVVGYNEKEKRLEIISYFNISKK